MNDPTAAQDRGRSLVGGQPSNAGESPDTSAVTTKNRGRSDRHTGHTSGPEKHAAAKIMELLTAAELDLHRQRTGLDGQYDPDLEAYLNGKCDGLRAALIATGEVETVKP